MDVALRSASLNQVAALGFGVHARPVRLLVPDGVDVAVHRHGASLARGGAFSSCHRRRHFQCFGHDHIGAVFVVNTGVGDPTEVPTTLVLRVPVHRLHMLGVEIPFPPPPRKAELSAFPPVAERGVSRQ